ncbi:hypothetical protein [Shinella sp. WSJ-2]|uniref:hypothetical protein n=1 Tax=Shinella sp. WSJ-2 TaxID=2303749 RepID=UPI0011C19F56|nr:hypothetical protein [Shinella sp. WSJ-2]
MKKVHCFPLPRAHRENQFLNPARNIMDGRHIKPGHAPLKSRRAAYRMAAFRFIFPGIFQGNGARGTHRLDLAQKIAPVFMRLFSPPPTETVPEEVSPIKRNALIGQTHSALASIATLFWQRENPALPEGSKERRNLRHGDHTNQLTLLTFPTIRK